MSRVLDVSRFDPIVDKALEAFGSDAGYAELMVRNAVAIEHKRQVWDVRLKLRETERRAVQLCTQMSLKCEAVSPCGFGDCRMSTHYETFVVISTAGPNLRPQQDSSFPSYDREHVVRAALAV